MRRGTNVLIKDITFGQRAFIKKDLRGDIRAGMLVTIERIFFPGYPNLGYVARIGIGRGRNTHVTWADLKKCIIIKKQ